MNNGQNEQIAKPCRRRAKTTRSGIFAAGRVKGGLPDLALYVRSGEFGKKPAHLTLGARNAMNEVWRELAMPIFDAYLSRPDLMTELSTEKGLAKVALELHTAVVRAGRRSKIYEAYDSFFDDESPKNPASEEEKMRARLVAIVYAARPHIFADQMLSHATKYIH